MITHKFIHDLFNRCISHTNNYSTRDIQMLYYIKFNKSIIESLNHLNFNYEQRDLFIFGYKTTLPTNELNDLVDAINRAFDDPTYELKQCLSDIQNIKLAPPIADDDNIQHHVFNFNGKFKTAKDIRLDYCPINEKYYTTHQNKKLFHNHTYFSLYSNYHYFGNVTITFNQYFGLDYMGDLDHFYDVTHYKDFNIDHAKKLSEQNPNLFKTIYQQYYVQ